MERLTTYGLAAVGLVIGAIRYFVAPLIEDGINKFVEMLPDVDMDELNAYLGRIANQDEP